jgi:uncharacterized protein
MTFTAYDRALPVVKQHRATARAASVGHNQAMKLGGPRRFRALVVALAAGVQLPALLTLGHLTGHYAAAMAAGTLVSIPFFKEGVHRPWDQRPRSRLHLYLGMWPFYVWWTICLVFLLLAPLTLALAAATRVSFKGALIAGGLAAVAGGLHALSRRPRVVKRQVAIPDLPDQLVGYRIVQLSDVHCGPFTPGTRVRRWVERANTLSGDLVAVTGDLITTGHAYVDTVARELGGLRARDGVFACMGNHDYFTDGEVFARALVREGLNVLRNRGEMITRGQASLYVAGVDDTWTRRNDVRRAMAARPHGAPAVLLAHDPDLVTEAAAAGVDLMLSGHTHGGQFAMPVASRRWNLARLMTPFTVDLYRLGKTALYVNRGLGTTGPPIRVGARPEITVLTLVKAQPTDVRMHDLAEDVIRHASA